MPGLESSSKTTFLLKCFHFYLQNMSRVSTRVHVSMKGKSAKLKPERLCNLKDLINKPSKLSLDSIQLTSFIHFLLSNARFLTPSTPAKACVTSLLFVVSLARNLCKKRWVTKRKVCLESKGLSTCFTWEHHMNKKLKWSYAVMNR